MTGQLDLFAGLPRCVLPGCAALVEVVGTPCDGCLTAFGLLLRATGTAPMTAAEIDERDQAVADAYREQREIAAADVERRANQRCWICEERRTCTRAPAGWECAACVAIV